MAPRFLERMIICALRGDIPNKLGLLFAKNQTFCLPPKSYWTGYATATGLFKHQEHSFKKRQK